MPLSKNAKLIPNLIAHNKTFKMQKRLGMYKFNSKDANPLGKMVAEVIVGRDDLLADYGINYLGMQCYIISSCKDKDTGKVYKLAIVPINDTWCSLVSFPKDSLKLLYRVANDN